MAFYKSSHLVLIAFASLLMGMYPSMSKSALDVFSPFSLSFFQFLTSSFFCFLIVIITYLMNDKAFDNFLSNYPIIIKKLFSIFLSSLGTVFIPIFSLNYSIYKSYTIVVGLLIPFIPFFTNLINRFGPSKEHLQQRKIAGIIFCISGIISSFSLYINNSYEHNKLNETLKPLFIYIFAEFSLSLAQRFTYDSLSECDPYFTPFLQNLSSLIISFISIFIFEGKSGIIFLFSITKKQLIAPVISGLLGIGIVFYISSYLFSTIGFSASTLIFYGSTFVSFIFGSISLREITTFDLPIIFAFIIGLLMQCFAMILEYQTPIFLNRKE